jgi:carboxyl-terminal processing protease
MVSRADRIVFKTLFPFTLFILWCMFFLPAAMALENTGSAARVSIQAEGTTVENDDLKRDVHLMYRALQLVHGKYREARPSRDLVYSAIRGMLQSLDPFTNFVEPKQSQEMGIRLKGEYGGLGIVISMKDKQLTVISPIDDTPAFQAGIRALDRILEIDGVSTRGITMDQSLNSMRGVPGTVCKLLIGRDGSEKPIPYEITRAIIKLRTVKWMMASEPFDKIGVIRVSSFNGDTATEFREAVKALSALNPSGIVLDLRSNPGGLLSAAVDMVSCLLPHGKLVVYTRGRVLNANASYQTNVDEAVTRAPLVVLVNESSASASEIVAGAVKDHNRGLLIGTRTFGKGSVQHIFPLFDGSSVVMTVAHYFTPGGTCIHEQGIEPHITVHMPSEVELKRINEKETYWSRRGREEQRRLALEKMGSGDKIAGETTESVRLSPEGVSTEVQGSEISAAGVTEESSISTESSVGTEKSASVSAEEKSDPHKMKSEDLDKDYQMRRALELLRLMPQIGNLGFNASEGK